MQKIRRYERIKKQLKELFIKTSNPQARMASICALLHHKFDYYFWTGFYFLQEGELTVTTYQGPLACMVLKKNQGVCWAAINEEKAMVVADVEQFPGHIACDSRSKSEIVIPIKKDNTIIGVLDVDSKELNSFDDDDRRGLESIVDLIFE